MCGIVGGISTTLIQHPLFEALSKLEYRGYDSSGIATCDQGKVLLRKTKGNMSLLKNLLEADPIDGHVGIAHTRWATHGEPNTVNGSPPCS